MVMSPWLQRWGQSAHPAARLFCFPNAGGAAALFRLWPQGLPRDLDVIAIQLPGRGNRWKEPAIPDIARIVDSLMPSLEPHLDLPFAFFGHSMGSMVAYAVAQSLIARGGPLPFHLFVSSRRSPRVANPADTPLHTLPDDAFVAEMRRRYGGIPDEVLAEPELMALLLPSLRADIHALETYVASRPAPLPFPVTAFGGLDDALTPRAHLEAWREETPEAFRVRMFAGGHFYLESRRDDLLADVRDTLAGAAALRARETGT
jgi:surfactin synthase thioesterase subunit